MRSRSGGHVQRREFITLLGSAAAWPLAARAQQPDRVRRVGVLLPATADDAEFQARMAAFQPGTGAVGLDHRPQRAHRHPLGHDRCRRDLQARGGIGRARARRHPGPCRHDRGALLQATRTVPVVFPAIGDPVGAGFVDSLARPGGNATGFISFEYSLSGKWLELLKEIAPSVTRVAVLRNAATPSGPGQFGAIQAVAPSLRVEVNPVNVRDAGEIEGTVAAFGRAPNGGLVVTASPLAQLHRELIVTLAARHKLPAVYFQRLFVAAGGLISYGANEVDQYRQSAGLRRSHPQGREACGLASTGAEQV